MARTVKGGKSPRQNAARKGREYRQQDKDRYHQKIEKLTPAQKRNLKTS